MNTNRDHRDILVEKRLKLPKKDQEVEMFLNAYDPIVIFDCFLPLADYLLDEYVCPNDDARMTVEESIYSGLLMCVIQFRRTKRYETDTTFTFYFTVFVRDLLDGLVAEGKIYKISKMQIVE